MSITLHMPYYTSNIPVIQFTDGLTTGVVHVENNNTIESGQIDMSETYFVTEDKNENYTSILCKTNNNKLGSFQLPDNNIFTSWVLTYGENKTYTWTDIEDIGLVKGETMSVFMNNTRTISIYGNDVLEYCNSKYIYNATLDLDILYDNTNNNYITKISDYVKSNSNVFIIFDMGTYSSTDHITNFSTLCKYAINVTDTTTTKLHVSKFIPDINVHDGWKYWITFVTMPVNGDINTIINGITQLTNDITLKAYGTLTVTEEWKSESN